MRLNYITFIQKKFNFSRKLASQIFEWSVEQAKHDQDEHDKTRFPRATSAELDQARKGFLQAWNKQFPHLKTKSDE